MHKTLHFYAKIQKKYLGRRHKPLLEEGIPFPLPDTPRGLPPVARPSPCTFLARSHSALQRSWSIYERERDMERSCWDCGTSAMTSTDDARHELMPAWCVCSSCAGIMWQWRDSLITCSVTASVTCITDEKAFLRVFIYIKRPLPHFYFSDVFF